MVLRHVRNIINPFYDSLDNITVERFFKCLEGDFRYIYKRYPQFTIKQPSERAIMTYSKVYEQYCDATSNDEQLRLFRLIGEITKLKNRYLVVGILLEGIEYGKPKEIHKMYCEELAHWGYIFDQNKTFEVAMKKLWKQYRGSKNRITILDAEIESIKIKDGGEKEISVMQQKISLQGMGFDIDIKTTVMTEWLEYWKHVANMSEEARKKSVKYG